VAREHSEKKLELKTDLLRIYHVTYLDRYDDILAPEDVEDYEADLPDGYVSDEVAEKLMDIVKHDRDEQDYQDYGDPEYLDNDDDCNRRAAVAETSSTVSCPLSETQSSVRRNNVISRGQRLPGFRRPRLSGQR